jgi:hypothetical protein
VLQQYGEPSPFSKSSHKTPACLISKGQTVLLLFSVMLKPELCFYNTVPNFRDIIVEDNKCSLKDMLYTLQDLARRRLLCRYMQQEMEHTLKFNRTPKAILVPHFHGLVFSL